MPNEHTSRSARRTPRHRLAWMLAVTGLANVTAAVSADTVTLRDGTVLTGAIKQVDNGYEFTTQDGGPRRFLTPDEVKAISLTNEGRLTPGMARERLLSLQRSVESEKDLNRIITRYQVFIQMNADTDAAKEAQTELDAYIKKREAGQTIHFGRAWLTPAERDERLVEAAKQIEQITALITAGRVDEASGMLREGLESQPDNVSMLYLNGVLQLRAGRFAEAKRSFDQVDQQVPKHPPTLLNKAVIATQSKQWPLALTLLDQALAGAPGAPEIIDAINEFAGIAPDQLKKSQTFERLMNRFAPQEAALEQQMAARGLFRFGSKWVDKGTIDKFNADKAEFEKKKADLEAQFDDSRQRESQISDEIDSRQRLMADMERDRTIILPEGKTITRPLPAAYFDLQREIGVLADQKRAEDTKQSNLRRQADEVKKTEPKVPYTGKLVPIGELGVPVLLPQQRPQDPTTQPQGGTAAAATTAPEAGPAANTASDLSILESVGLTAPTSQPYVTPGTTLPTTRP